MNTDNQLLTLLKENKFKFNKGLGQNFIFDKNLLKAIVHDASITSADTVVEIGTGAGTLTLELAAVAKKIYTFEVDKNLSSILEKTFEPYNNIELHFTDILRIKQQDFKNIVNVPFKIVANLPYYITTPILTHLIENTKRIDGYVVMMQREVANRLNAKVGTKDYNSLTILLNYYTNVEYLFTVPKKVFVPAPNVESAVVKIMTKEERDFEADSNFFKFVRSCFVQRRKTLLNNLISSYGKDKKQNFQDSCLDCDIDSKRRSETLTLMEFYNLYTNLKNNDLI